MGSPTTTGKMEGMDIHTEGKEERLVKKRTSHGIIRTRHGPMSDMGGKYQTERIYRPKKIGEDANNTEFADGG